MWPGPARRARASAKGWHGVQMAALGFIGLCGVLQRDDGDDPRWLLRVVSATGPVTVSLQAVSSLRPVGSC